MNSAINLLAIIGALFVASVLLVATIMIVGSLRLRRRDAKRYTDESQGV